MLKSEPEKIAKVLHDLYVLLPVIQEHGTEEWVEKHLELIEYYKFKYDEANYHWSYFSSKAA